MLVLRAALMGYAHASLVMKDLTVAAARKAIPRQLTRHVKVHHCFIGDTNMIVFIMTLVANFWVL